MRARLAAIAVLATSFAACSSTEHPSERPHPTRFAVLAGPSVGQDDGDLLDVVTKVSREKDLAFVLVLGPLLAPDADATSLELLKNDLGQIAAPVYVAFAATAPVATDATAGKVTGEEILGAVEGFGPGPAHLLAYVVRPPRARSVVVNALAPDGSGVTETLPEGATTLVAFRATPDPTARGVRAEVLVATAPGDALVLEGRHADEPAASREPVVVLVPRLGTKRFAVVTIGELDVEAALVPVAGTAPEKPRPVRLPAIDRKPPG